MGNRESKCIQGERKREEVKRIERKKVRWRESTFENITETNSKYVLQLENT